MCPTASLIDSKDMVKLCQKSPFRFLGKETIKMVRNIEHFRGAWQFFGVSFLPEISCKTARFFYMNFSKKRKENLEC